MKKIKWSVKEDNSLLLWVQKYGNKKWKIISKEFNSDNNLQRNANQIRQRYMNYLYLQKENKNLENNDIIEMFSLFRQYGPKWSIIGKKLNKSNTIVKINFYKWLRQF